MPYPEASTPCSGCPLRPRAPAPAAAAAGWQGLERTRLSRCGRLCSTPEWSQDGMLAIDGSMGRDPYSVNFCYLSIAGDMRRKETCKFKEGRRTRMCGEDLTIDLYRSVTRLGTARLTEEMPTPKPAAVRCTAGFDLMRAT